jgi:hypothetical protein
VIFSSAGYHRIKAVTAELWLMHAQPGVADGAVAKDNWAELWSEWRCRLWLQWQAGGQEFAYLGRLKWVVWREVDVKEVHTRRVRRACVTRHLVEQCCDQQWR